VNSFIPPENATLSLNFLFSGNPRTHNRRHLDPQEYPLSRKIIVYKTGKRKKESCRVAGLVVDDRDIWLVRSGWSAGVHDDPRIGQLHNARVLVHDDGAAQDARIEVTGSRHLADGDEQPAIVPYERTLGHSPSSVGRIGRALSWLDRERKRLRTTR
jgi:hypothetical protein